MKQGLPVKKYNHEYVVANVLGALTVYFVEPSVKC